MAEWLAIAGGIVIILLLARLVAVVLLALAGDEPVDDPEPSSDWDWPR